MAEITQNFHKSAKMHGMKRFFEEKGGQGERRR